MPVFGLLYKALKKFLSPTPLNKGEVDQPAPFTERRKHLLKQLDDLDREIAAYHANGDRPIYIPDQYR